MYLLTMILYSMIVISEIFNDEFNPIKSTSSYSKVRVRYYILHNPSSSSSTMGTVAMTTILCDHFLQGPRPLEEMVTQDGCHGNGSHGTTTTTRVM